MSFPDLGAAGIIVTAILAFAVIGFLKGLIRTVLAMICLGIAGYAALWGNDHTSVLTSPWMDNPGPWIPKVIGVLTGLAVFFICRYILHFLIDPFNQSKTGKKIGFGLPAAALSLCAGLIILWLGCTGIRYGASIAELRHTQQLVYNQEDEDTTYYTSPALMRTKQALDGSDIGKWQRSTDFFDAPLKLNLCKLLILYHHKETREKMLKDKTLNTLFNDAAFLELAYDDSVQKFAQSDKPRKLYHANPLDAFLSNETQAEMIKSLPSGHLETFIAKPE